MTIESALSPIYDEDERVSAPRGAWTAGIDDFGDAACEAAAARDEAAIFDLTLRTHLTLTGRDRARFLHGFCTNDIKKLQPGEGCEAFVTNIKGRIVDHIFVFVDAEAIHIEATAGREDALFAHLDRYLITDDVQIARRSGELGTLFVAGPRAAARLSDVASLDELAPCGHLAADVRGTAVQFRRVDLFGEPGFALVAARPALADLWQALVASGIFPAGRTVFEANRIAAGLPAYGVDLTEDNLAQEAMRTRRCISFTKGCYLGQEPIARLDALGHVNRQLAGLRLHSNLVPAPGAQVTADGKEAGVVTSSILEPSKGRAIALGMLRSSICRPAQKVVVSAAGSSVAAEVFVIEQ